MQKENKKTILQALSENVDISSRFFFTKKGGKLSSIGIVRWGLVEHIGVIGPTVGPLGAELGG